MRFELWDAGGEETTRTREREKTSERRVEDDGTRY